MAKSFVSWTALGLLLLFVSPAHGMSEAERKAYLDKFNQIMPDVPAFTAWEQKTGALPPDFDALPKTNNLPDPFTFLDGRPVNMPADWEARRTEIRGLFEQFMLGKIPPKPPLDKVEVESETKSAGYLTRNVVLHFGPQSAGIMHATLVIPGNGPEISGSDQSQGNSNNQFQLRRGYIGVSYRASDTADDADAARGSLSQVRFRGPPPAGVGGADGHRLSPDASAG